MLRGADVVLVAGADAFRDLFYQSYIVLPASTTMIHIDPRANEVGKSEPTDIGIVADMKLALGQLADALESALPKNGKKPFRHDGMILRCRQAVCSPNCLPPSRTT
jgi:thiamine pyrophosphate-dependent acetolactate synthase large subunit-like protein